MIEAYTNQTAVWKAKGEVNQYNEPTYADPVTIKCRIEYKNRMVRNKQGQEIISESTIITKSPVKSDDIITFDDTDWVVIISAPQAGLGGSTEFYEVMM